MSASLVQGKGGTSGVADTGFALTLNSPTTGGNLLEVVASAKADSGTPTLSIADNKSNSFTPGPTTSANGIILKTWYVPNCLSGSGHQFTLTVTGGNGSYFPEMVVGEWAGVATASPLDKSAVTAASGDTSTASTGTLTQADELVTTAMATLHAGSTVTPGAGYTLVGTVQNGQLGYAYKTVASTAAVTGTWANAADSQIATVATYKAAAGGAPALDEDEGIQYYPTTWGFAL